MDANNYYWTFFRVYCPKCDVRVGDFRWTGQAIHAMKDHNAADDARGLKGKGRRAYVTELIRTRDEER
jgi:hypothetical protein